MAGNLGCVIVAVDGSEESMNALKWSIDNVRLRPGGSFVVLHAQSPPSITAGLNPRAIPFGGPSDLEVPAFTAAIEAHQRRITKAIMAHALQICSDKNVNVKTQVVIGDPKEKICEVVEDLHADLLVMGCRSFGPIRSLAGSVAHLLQLLEGYAGKHDFARSSVLERSKNDRQFNKKWLVRVMTYAKLVEALRETFQK